MMLKHPCGALEITPLREFKIIYDRLAMQVKQQTDLVIRHTDHCVFNFSIGDNRGRVGNLLKISLSPEDSYLLVDPAEVVKFQKLNDSKLPNTESDTNVEIEVSETPQTLFKFSSSGWKKFHDIITPKERE